jgi:hypothetical protein
MFESSAELADGTVVEFMESLFPRDTLVPAGYKPLFDNADMEPMAERFRFLSGGDIWLDFPNEGKKKTAVANRFDVAPGATIDWYVTANAPAQYMTAIQAGVEGWNRYFKAAQGRDVMKFKGILPANIRLGDPRYNVINWDSVNEAGAAYESQAYDPYTGIQSHSLVYLPNAWVNIGKEYWKNGGFSRDATQPLTSTREVSNQKLSEILKNGQFLGRKLDVNCINAVEAKMSLGARTSPEDFAIELLKGVLFHEIGHALGLAHNFKGSLSFDPDSTKPVFSTSIMDYNQYQIEDAAFSSLNSSDGPQLEYDRQIISVLYNSAKDIATTDAVLGACNDSEADDVSGGVDALCIRYDSGQDPTKMLERTIELVKDENAKAARMTSLAKALRSTQDVLTDASVVTTEAQANEVIAKLGTQIRGTVVFYYGGGAQSLNYMIRSSVKSLRVLKVPLPPAGYDISQMRDRVSKGLSFVLNMNGLEPSAKQAVADLQKATKTWLESTPWYLGLAADQAQEKSKSILGKMETSLLLMTEMITSTVRSAVLSNLQYIETAPFAFDIISTGGTDFERLAIETLEAGLTTQIGGHVRAASERQRVAAALASFSEVQEGKQAIARVVSRLQTELPLAKSATERKGLRDILKAFNP